MDPLTQKFLTEAISFGRKDHASEAVTLVIDEFIAGFGQRAFFNLLIELYARYGEEDGGSGSPDWLTEQKLRSIRKQLERD